MVIRFGEADTMPSVLMALSDRGVPFYDEALGKKISAVGIPCFACTPDRLPELIEAALKGKDLLSVSADIKESQKK